MYSHVLEVPLNIVYEELVKGHGEIHQEGTERYRATCPQQVHDTKNKHGIDEHPSLIIEKRNGFWQCHCESCGFHGDAVSLLYLTNGLKSSKEADDMLVGKFNLHLTRITLSTYAASKGFTLEFLADKTILEDEAGLLFPYYEKDTSIPYYTKTRHMLNKKKGSSGAKFSLDKAGLPIIPYGLDAEKDNCDTVYICEGETDALTVMYTGLNCLGFPGAETFNELCRLAIEKYAHIIIIADNDEAGKKLVRTMVKEMPDKDIRMLALPDYFGDINDLHVRRFYGDPEKTRNWILDAAQLPCSVTAFVRGIETGEANWEERRIWSLIAPTLVSRSDEEVMLRRVTESVDLFINKDDPNAFSTKNGIRTLRPAMRMKGLRKILEAKLAAAKCTDDSYGALTVEDGGYMRVGENGPIRITTFTWTLEHILRSPETYEVSREVEITNYQGMKVRRTLESGDISNPIAFTKVIRSLGQGFNFLGSKTDLDFLVEEMDSRPDVDELMAPPYYGRIVHKRGSSSVYAGWIFANVGIDTKGEVFEISPDGIVDLDGVRYRVPHEVPPITIGIQYASKSEKLVLETIKGSMLGSLEGWKSLAWMCASFYSPAMLENPTYGYFPILMHTGLRDSGKTYLTRLLLSAFGQQSLSSGTSAAKDTKVGISRHLGRYSCIPCFLDEYNLNGSSAQKVRSMNPTIQAVFNHQGAMKGTRVAGEVLEEEIRANLIVCGESIPDEAALQSRMVIATLSGHKLDRSKASAVADLGKFLPGIYGKWARDSATDEGKARFIKAIGAAEYLMKTAGVSGRMIDSATVVLAGWMIGFAEYVSEEESDAFISYVISNAVEKMEENVLLTDVSCFLDFFVELFADKTLVDDVDYKLSTNYKPGFSRPTPDMGAGNYIFIQNCKMYQKYCDYAEGVNATVPPWQSLAGVMKDEPYVLDTSYKTRQFSNGRRCTVLDIDNLPKEVQDVIHDVLDSFSGSTGNSSEY